MAKNFQYSNVEGDIAEIKRITGEITTTLDHISALYNIINNSDEYRGSSAAAYQDTFEQLKNTVFNDVPIQIDEVDRLIRKAKNELELTESNISKAANINGN